jgi:hypothetical protein
LRRIPFPPPRPSGWVLLLLYFLPVQGKDESNGPGGFCLAFACLDFAFLFR